MNLSVIQTEYLEIFLHLWTDFHVRFQSFELIGIIIIIRDVQYIGTTSVILSANITVFL